MLIFHCKNLCLIASLVYYPSSSPPPYPHQAMAPTWQTRSGEYDGVTTNGVAFMWPAGVFESGVQPGDWREVTIGGNVKRMREERSARAPGAGVSIHATPVHLVQYT